LRALSRGFVCVGGKVKNFFSGTGTKTRRMASNTPINRLIFQLVAQLMYALSRVNCAFRACGREGPACAARGRCHGGMGSCDLVYGGPLGPSRRHFAEGVRAVVRGYVHALGGVLEEDSLEAVGEGVEDRVLDAVVGG
jgi:hypothetical protein